MSVTLAFTLLVFYAAARPAAVPAAKADAPVANLGWPTYNGDPAGTHFSSLTQITPGNVRQLKQVWRFDVGASGGLQTNPLIVGHTLYAYTPALEVIALDAATGKSLWTFKPPTGGGQPSRGLTYWTDGKQSRLFAGVMNFLYALDPATGTPIADFGEDGRLDLRKDLDSEYTHNSVVLTTPGVLYHDLILLGFRAPESHPAPHGDIRAYNVRTGKLVWSFHTIPHPGEEGYTTWPAGAWETAGAANNWPGMAVDSERGIVFAPTGSAVSDFYGGDRTGDDLFANTLLALDANTGKKLWHFQDVHHDIWDRDFPSPPVLVTVQHEGKPVDAVAQTTKHGFVFVFDRVTGKSLFPIEERPFPASTVPGEVTSPTQPIPLAPAPYARQRLTTEMLTTRTPAAHAAALAQFKTFRSGGQFLPLAVDQQTVVLPGFDGGTEWGGVAVDPHTAILYLNANDVPWTGGLTASHAGSPGSLLYQSQCALCHGTDRTGNPPAFPSLVGIDRRLSPTQIADTIHNGRGRMPSFPDIQQATLTDLLDFLANPTEPAASGKRELASPTPGQDAYRFTGYRRFTDHEGYPAIVPPWGTLNALDLNTGQYLWKVPLGQYPELVAQGLPDTGSENYGGPIVTASGLLFIGATIYDHTLRAFDTHTGKILWQADLPFPGNATPSTYMVDGKQYIVIATSGARNPKGPQGAAYVAFALP